MHLHKRLTAEQVVTIFKGYSGGLLNLNDACQFLSIKRSRFFVLLKGYQKDPAGFTLFYKRETPSKLPKKTEVAIKKMLEEERDLIRNPQIPLFTYNYSALKDRLENEGMNASLPAIIRRARKYDCYQPKKHKQAIHDQIVITEAIGALIQHDASIHLWSPFAKSKWSLITSLDDFSRMLLFADLFEKETTWAHILSTKYLMTNFGIPLNYYVDSLRTFRFVSHQDSIHVAQRVGTDQVNPRWKAVVKGMGTDVIHALSPQAKGKVERPYRWIQDRIVRTCALEKVTEIDEAREVLRFEVNRYNTKQVHSTTKEIPLYRFERAGREGKSLFRPFVIPKPYNNLNDIFCFKEKRITNGYRRISIYSFEIQIPKVPPYEEVLIHLAPNETKNTVEARIWYQNQLVYKSFYPLSCFKQSSLES